jgi:hypothetical protein
MGLPEGFPYSPEAAIVAEIARGIVDGGLAGGKRLVDVIWTLVDPGQVIRWNKRLVERARRKAAYKSKEAERNRKRAERRGGASTPTPSGGYKKQQSADPDRCAESDSDDDDEPLITSTTDLSGVTIKNLKKWMRANDVPIPSGVNKEGIVTAMAESKKLPEGVAYDYKPTQCTLCKGYGHADKHCRLKGVLSPGPEPGGAGE